MIINEAARRNFGFASNMVVLLWCVCGGFLLHMLECNYLTILLAPVYEKPVDSAEDIHARGLTVICIPGRETIIDEAKRSPYPLVKALAEKTIVPEVISISQIKHLFL